MPEKGKRILVVGGVAGGASCAARARRLSEAAEIIIFERGPFVSFANCGLPYYVGDVIPDEEDLLVATPRLFRDRFNIEVRTRSEVVAIDRAAREIEVQDLVHGRRYRERYDALVLAPGAAPIRPPLPGIDLPGIFTLRTIPDSRAMRDWIASHRVRRSAIVGGGFIGLEMVENLARRGIEVSLLEMLPQVMPPLDPEMATLVHRHLVRQGVSVYLSDPVVAFHAADGGLVVETESGRRHPAEMVVLAIGVRPEVALARQAGLEIGERGGIRVDGQMRTSDEHIWAVGDAAEVRDVITGQWVLLPLAGPANRQGRVAADAIMGRDSRFRGVQGTAVCKVFDITIALTGASERALQRAGDFAYQKVYVYGLQHAGYYPGATEVSLKLIYAVPDGRILGAQAVGRDGVEKRIDVISMAVQKGGTVFDLEEAELCYAPQFGSARDVVNIAGMQAANALRGDAPVASPEEADRESSLVLDVRNDDEYAAGHITGAVHIPLDELRRRLGELPHGRDIITCCRVGHRSYYATRILRQHGLGVRNLSGGYVLYRRWQAALAPGGTSAPGGGCGAGDKSHIGRPACQQDNSSK